MSLEGQNAEASQSPQQVEKVKLGWLSNVLDVEEAKHQILFALPMILTNVAYYFIPLIPVMFTGHLGELELAASNLAQSWASVSGFCVMTGLSGSLETLCGQGFGAKVYGMLGIYLQSSCIITSFFATALSIMWWYSDIILTVLHQDPEIAKLAGVYLKYLIPGLFAYGFLQNILRFLQTQSVVMPLVVCSLIPLSLHIGITYTLVHHTRLAFRGAPLAASISLWISVLMLGLYVVKATKFKHTWKGLTFESFNFVYINAKLALPSAAMLFLEFAAVEVLVLLAGTMPNSEITTPLTAMCVNTEAITYMVAYGLAAAASTRVSNELGAGNPIRAKQAMYVTLKINLLLAICIVSALALGHNQWASLFSNNPKVINAFASMTPLIVISILWDYIQSILSGTARGCGWQHWVVLINLGVYYLVGMPIAYVLGINFKLHVKGLWIGFICGLSLQTIGLLLLTLLRKWKRIELLSDESSLKTELGQICPPA